jgi:hypothetical protein
MRRFQLTRESFIPKHAAKVAAKNSTAVAYLSNPRADAFYAVGFCGKQQKPAFNYSFRTEARRAEFVSNWFVGIAKGEESKVARRAARKSFRHTLQLGDVLRASWGYDQTNIDYYQVVALVGESMVEVRAIGSLVTETTGFMQGKCVPCADSFTGPVLRRRVSEGNAVRINDSASAYPVEMVKVGGVRIAVKADHWTAYA